MQLLILGGTAFVGRHLVEAARSRGHAVTLFNRGRRNPGLYPEATHLVGDRDGGLAALADGRWDAVIDTSGYLPRLVRASAEALAARVGQYVFISTISIYAEPTPGLAEGAPLKTLADPTVEVVEGETYGGLKVLCEQAVQAVYGDRALIVRPGIIAGPYDTSDRFTYWAQAMASGDPVVAPAPAEAPVQVIDARDLAAWIVRMVEAGETGTYNATGPAEPLTRAGFLAALTPAGVQAPITWLEADALAAEGLEAATAFPFWTPPDSAGILAVDASKARLAGLALRPLAETADDTRAWLAGEPARPLKVGLDATTAARLARSAAGGGSAR